MALLALMVWSGLACNLSELATRLSTPTPGPAAQATPVVVVSTPTLLPPELIEGADVEELLVINVYARVSPAVVCITASEQFEAFDADHIADYGIERFYRDVRLFRLYEGTSQIQQLVIAREVLKGEAE
mgnify:CR=1 FL=1